MNHLARCSSLSTLTLLASALATIALGSALPTRSAQAQTCINQNAPAPLEICAHAGGNHQIWVQQPNGRIHQYFSSTTPSNGWLLRLQHSAGWTTHGHYISDESASPTSGVSNTLSGTGSSVDPWILRTERHAADSQIRWVQELIYVNGERSLRKRWTISNDSAEPYRNLSFFQGGDAYFGGTDDARGWYDPGNQMVYLTNRDFNNYGYMGMAPHPATPSTHYYAGRYTVGRDSARRGPLPDAVNSGYSDAGYYLQWDKANLQPGESWVIEAREIWTPPGMIQSFAPAPLYLIAGQSQTVNFRVQNVADTPAPMTAAADISGNWSAVLQGDASHTLQGLEVVTLPVEVTLPGSANGTETLTLMAATLSHTTQAQTTVGVLDIDYLISPEQVDFGPAVVGDTSTRSVTFTNLSTTTALTLGQLDPAHSLGSGHGVQDDLCSGQTLASGASCSVTLTHTPTIPISSSGTLQWPLVAPVMTTLHSQVGASQGHFIVRTSTPTNGGSISPQSAAVQPGEQTSFTLQPDQHYSLGSVSGCSGTLSGNTYTTGAINAACTVTVTFARPQHTVSTDIIGNGDIAPRSRTVNQGDTATFTVAPAANHRLVGVSGCDGQLEGDEYTTGVITQSCRVTAEFERIQHLVSTSVQGEGSLSPSSVQVGYGLTSTFTVAAAAGHHLVSVTGCSGQLSGNQYTTGTITEACAIDAVFAINTYRITATPSVGGTLHPLQATATHGQSLRFTATPQTGTYIHSMLGCGGRRDGNDFVIDAVTEVCTVYANFALIEYQVTASSTGNGSITPAVSEVAHERQTSFTITPDEGHSIGTVSGCDGMLNGAEYTTGPITSACSVTASFTLDHYDVTVATTGNGSITPATNSIGHGQRATLTVTAGTGYSIDAVTGCGGTLEVNQYTTGPVTEACTVSANFTLNHYEVTATSTGNGNITPATSSVAHGQRASLSVMADDGYRISAVSGCDGSLEGGTFTTAEINADCAVTASFERSVPLFSSDLSPLDLDASALHTVLPDSLYPQAIAADGSVLRAELISSSNRFLPGRHELQWRVMDAEGRSATATQVLRVWPKVSMGKNVRSGLRRGDHGTFRIALSGAAPEYPFEVSYEVSAAHPELDLRAGRIRFEAGELEKDVHFAVIAEPGAGVDERSVDVWLTNARNIASQDRLKVLFSRTNLAPTVSVLALREGASASAFDRNGGAITLQPLIADPNASDNHQVTWDIPAGASVTTPDDRLILDASSLQSGVYRFQVHVQDDGVPALRTTAMIDLVLLDQSPTLPEGAVGWQENGLPDHPDYALPMRNVLPEVGGELHHYLLETQAGLQLALGSHARLADAAQAQISPEALALPLDAVPNIGGYFDFQIGALPSPGQNAAIVLPQHAAIPEHAVYRKYDARQRHWYTFVEDDRNQLASAPGTPGHCPPPDSNLYRDGLNAGDWCVRLTLEDGGPNDGDGDANGAILDPGGVGLLEAVTPVAPSPSPSPSPPPSTESRSRGGRGSADMWLLLLFVILILIRTAIRSMARHR